MARIRLGWRFPTDQATLTASSAARYYPAANLQNSALSQVWRSGGTSAVETLSYDFGEPVDVNCIVIDAHTLPADTVLKWQSSSDGSYMVPAAEEAIPFHAGRIIHFMAGPLRYRYGRLYITKPSAATVAQVAIVKAGQYFELDFNPSTESVKWNTENLGSVRQDRSGETSATLGAQQRTLSFGVPWVADATRQELQALDVSGFGKLIPFYLVFNADAANPYDETLYGRLAEGVDFSGWKGGAALRALTFSMIEELYLADS